MDASRGFSRHESCDRLSLLKDDALPLAKKICVLWPDWRGAAAVFLCLTAWLPLAAPLRAQADSRAELIREARRKKSQKLEPPEHGRTEKLLLQLEEEALLQRPLPVQFGGLPTGQGFAVGPRFLADRIQDGAIVFQTSLVGATSESYLADAHVTFPKLFGGKMFANVFAQQRNFSQLDYYGPGPLSEKGARSSYRLEGPTFGFTAGFQPLKYLRFGVTGGYLDINVGPGERTGVIETDKAFTPLTTPGVFDQTDFLRAGGFAAFDYRDSPGDPKSGGVYSADFSYYDDQGLQRHTFRRLDLEAQQYFPFFNKTHVIALRARTSMSWAGGTQSVPFYLQPRLGGSDDLRGFRPFRFHDDNHIVVNAEYRWYSFAGLDMAAFFDAGKVVPGRSQVNFHDLEGSAGFGLRFNAQGNVFMRLDFGFSHEGYQVWFKFANPF